MRLIQAFGWVADFIAASSYLTGGLSRCLAGVSHRLNALLGSRHVLGAFRIAAGLQAWRRLGRCRPPASLLSLCRSQQIIHKRRQTLIGAFRLRGRLYRFQLGCLCFGVCRRGDLRRARTPGITSSAPSRSPSLTQRKGFHPLAPLAAIGGERTHG